MADLFCSFFGGWGVGCSFVLLSGYLFAGLWILFDLPFFPQYFFTHFVHTGFLFLWAFKWSESQVCNAFFIIFFLLIFGLSSLSWLIYLFLSVCRCGIWVTMMTFQVWKLPNTWAHAPTGLMGFGDSARSIRFQGTGACCSLRCDQVYVCVCVCVCVCERERDDWEYICWGTKSWFESFLHVDPLRELALLVKKKL